jgi:hypothetical protein
MESYVNLFIDLDAAVAQSYESSEPAVRFLPGEFRASCAHPILSPSISLGPQLNRDSPHPNLLVLAYQASRDLGQVPGGSSEETGIHPEKLRELNKELLVCGESIFPQHLPYPSIDGERCLANAVPQVTIQDLVPSDR